MVQDLAAQAPVFKPKPTSRSVPENYETEDSYGTAPDNYDYPNVGAVVTATDPNGDTMTYSLGGADMGSFSINQVTGQITVKAATKLNLEAKPTYMVTVTATDPGNLSDSVDVTIKLTDDDEGPEIEVGGLALSGPRSVSYAEDRTDAVGTYTASGPDADSARVWLTGEDASDFSIDGGELTFDRSPDFENAADADGHNTYSVTVNADDGTYSDTHDVTVTVTDVDELGTITGDASVSYMENGMNAVETYTARDAVTWWLEGDDAGEFSINGGELTFRTEPDFENPADKDNNNAYEVTVKAAAGGEMEMRAVTVTVTNEDEPGTVSLTTMNPLVGTELTASVDDPDASVTATWQWARSNAMDGTYINIDGATNASYTPTMADDGMWLRATASYDDGVEEADTAIGTTDNAVISHTSPAFGEDAATLAVAENTAADENIGGPFTATDIDGDTPVYSLSGTDAASFGIDEGTGQLMTLAALDHEDNNTYMVTVQVRDNEDAMGAPDSAVDDTIEVTIDVTNVEEMGTVALDSGQPMVGTPLTASVTDPDVADQATVTWQWARSPDGMDGTYTPIDGATNASYIPGDDDDGMYLQAMASYSDGEGSGKDAMMATANAVTSVPEFLDADGNAITEDTRSVDENTAAGENVGAPVEATDANTGDTLTYTLGGTDMASFGIDSTNGQITVGEGTTLDYETQKRTYSVTVTATDGRGESATVDVTITITVNNVDEPGTVMLSLEQPAVGTELMATLTDLDGEPTDVTWQWANSDSNADDAAWEDIEGATGESYTPGDADDGMYLRATASYTDPQGSGKSAMTATANAVTSVPEFLDADGNAITEDTRSVDENTGAGGNVGDPVEATDANTGDTLTYTLGGTDMASFGIDSTNGQITVGEGTTLDYETQATTYDVTVTATDGRGESATVDVTITITVNNVDEPGTVMLSLEQPAVGTELMATLTDLDGEPTDVTWQWANSDSKGEDAIWTDIEGATGASYTPVATEVDKFLRATASYTDPQGSGKTAVAASERAVKASNNAPEFPSATDTRSVEENTAAGENVGPLVLAMDADHDTLIYTLGGADMAAFGINEQTGQLVTAGALDYETLASYTVDVTATDPAGAQDTVTVTISVTNVDEDGTVTLSTADPMFGEEITGTVSDIDGDPTGVTWQWARETADGYADISGATSAGYTPVAEDNGKLLRATASYSDPQGSGKTAMAATANAVPARDPDYYDANGDGVIDRDEAVTAVTDYFADRITKDETIAVITRYFES